jgi:hypothetical protein
MERSPTIVAGDSQPLQLMESAVRKAVSVGLQRDFSDIGGTVAFI